MSVSKWAYTPEVCDGDICVGDCDLCSKTQEASAVRKEIDMKNGIMKAHYDCGVTYKELDNALKHGTWKSEYDLVNGGYRYYCSECDGSYSEMTLMHEGFFNYCPFCGAKMKGEHDD